MLYHQRRLILMCIALTKKEGTTIDKDILLNCYNSNPDGAGFGFIDNEEIHIKKGYFNFDKFYRDYVEFEHKNLLIHFRIKTHGDICEELTHPFIVDDSLIMIHNGIISETTGKHSAKESDTTQFIEHELRPLIQETGYKFLDESNILHKLIEQRIGTSKLMFLDKNDQFHYFNKNLCNQETDIVFSNLSWKRKVFSQGTYYNTRKDEFKQYQGYSSPKNLNARSDSKMNQNSYSDFERNSWPKDNLTQTGMDNSPYYRKNPKFTKFQKVKKVQLKNKKMLHENDIVIYNNKSYIIDAIWSDWTLSLFNVNSGNTILVSIAELERQLSFKQNDQQKLIEQKSRTQYDEFDSYYGI